jgi:hypothetical protein
MGEKGAPVASSPPSQTKSMLALPGPCTRPSLWQRQAQRSSGLHCKGLGCLGCSLDSHGVSVRPDPDAGQARPGSVQALGWKADVDWLGRWLHPQGPALSLEALPGTGKLSQLALIHPRRFACLEYKDLHPNQLPQRYTGSTHART